MGSSWVLITGASTGFGEQLARRYAGNGHSLILVARQPGGLQQLGDELRQTFRIDVVTEQADLSEVAAAIELDKRLRERGISMIDDR